MAGKRAVVTSGPDATRPIDPVRYISNHSSGKQGHAIASALAALGADVTLVSGPVAIADPQGVTTVHIELGRPDAGRLPRRGPHRHRRLSPPLSPTGGPLHVAGGKIKKKAGTAPPSLELAPNPDILATHLEAPGPQRPALVVGFAAETENLVANAIEQAPAEGLRLDRRQRCRHRHRDLRRRFEHRASGHRRRRRDVGASVQGCGGRRARQPDRRKDRRPMTARLQIPVRRLPHGEGLPLPRAQTDGAAGMDLVAALPADAPVTLAPRARAAIPTGLELAIPPGYEGQVRPRSGLAMKHGLTVANAPGTIDSDYRGEIKVLLINLGDTPVLIARGERIAQLVIAPVTVADLITVDKLDETTRGIGGFGSTGR